MFGKVVGASSPRPALTIASMIRSCCVVSFLSSSFCLSFFSSFRVVVGVIGTRAVDVDDVGVATVVRVLVEHRVQQSVHLHTGHSTVAGKRTAAPLSFSRTVDVDAVVAVVVDVDDGVAGVGVLRSTGAEAELAFLAMCARMSSLHRFTPSSLSSPKSSAVLPF